LVLGETGTGKELFATLAHDKSGRKGTLLAINCAALPADILDAELFGHAKGAYTGADRDRPGLIEAASGGTLFLDEIGEMSLAVQGRLLRAIEAKEIRRLGENHPRKVTTRFVGATHRDLSQMVKDGKFRADLFFRLRGIVVTLPPLRERPDDILLLADHFLGREGSRIGREFQLTKDAREKMCSHPWPGNVRELKSVIERAAAMCESGDLIAADDLGIDWIQGSGSLAEHLENEERRSLLAILESVDWNRSEAARQLKIRRTTLLGKLIRLGIEKPRKKK
jgi:transcriptional regulator with PAS, ATPase and Fis domain